MASLSGSVTSRRADLTDRWVGYIAHQLNTVMRHVIETPSDNHARTSSDLDRVKKIVRIFKQSGWANKIEVGSRFIQAAETPFGSYDTVAERFIASSTEDYDIVVDAVRRLKKPQAKELFDALTTHHDFNGKWNVPSIQAIVICFFQFVKCRN